MIKEQQWLVSKGNSKKPRSLLSYGGKRKGFLLP